MAILFGLQKKLLARQLVNASKKAKKLSETRKREAMQEKELTALKNKIKMASKVKISKANQAVLKGKSDSRKKQVANAKKTAKFVGKTGLDFAVKLGKFIDSNVAVKNPRKPAMSRKKVSKRKVKSRKRYY